MDRWNVPTADRDAACCTTDYAAHDAANNGRNASNPERRNSAMTQELTRKEALELAQKIMTDAEAERAACAEAEARRTTDAVGHWPVVTGSAVGGDFYKGIEWFACWLLDNNEGETIYEERLRSWAADAWKAHLKQPNAEISGRAASAPKP